MQDQKPINSDFKNKDILSLSQFDPNSINLLFKKTQELESQSPEELSTILKNKIVTLLFSEPSTRTFGSFAVAVKRLGGQTLELTSPSENSFAKGETLEDTIRVLDNYSDLIVIRHPEIGSADIAAKNADAPVINAGDGAGEHPTQALLDLYTIYKKFQTLENLNGVIAGDIKNGRTVHSLLKGLSLFTGNKIYLLAPDELTLSQELVSKHAKNGLEIIVIKTEEEIPQDAHFWYWTRVQKERFSDQTQYEKVKNSFILTQDLLGQKGNSDLILMHPLPRVGEIEAEIDNDKRALYLTDQIQNGLYVRMALLTSIIGKS